MSNAPIKIFAGDKPIYLTGLPSPPKEIILQNKETLYHDGEKEIDSKAILKELADEGINSIVLWGKDIEAVKKNFLLGFELIEAAGGIVQNDKKEILFIFRKGKWDLPKGKTETGENLETCAEREIEEETGVKGLKLKKKIGDTYHIYTERGKDIIKISSWYYFTCTGKQHLHAQTEEDITEVKWIPTQKIKEPMEETYETIRDIMREFFDTP